MGQCCVGCTALVRRLLRAVTGRSSWSQPTEGHQHDPHSQEALVTTDLGEEAPMHHNASYEDIGNTDIEFACNVRKTISDSFSRELQLLSQLSGKRAGNSFAHTDGRQQCANPDGLSEIGITDLCTYREMYRGIHARTAVSAMYRVLHTTKMDRQSRCGRNTHSQQEKSRAPADGRTRNIASIYQGRRQ